MSPARRGFNLLTYVESFLPNGETIFALAISTYPDACTDTPECTAPGAAEQMDAIFESLAEPLSP